MKKTKKSKNSNAVGKDFSEDLDNFNDFESESTIRKLSIESIQIDLNNNSDKKQIKKKLTKEDLNNIPLPVFSCIYCSNDIIAFRHLIQEIITNKYLFQTSVYDIRDIRKAFINKSSDISVKQFVELWALKFDSSIEVNDVQ